MASPPHVPQLNMPRGKRGSISSVSGAKKRKPSQLRNAYSPESESIAGSPLRYSRSPSVDSVAASVANSVGGRKRKRKDGDAASVTGSLRGGKALSSLRGGEGDPNGIAGENGEANGEEDDEDEVSSDEDMDAVLEGGKSTAATRRQEEEYVRMLVEAMSEQQQARWETYRRIRLKRDTVRKLVNQTLSQSVPQPVIIAVTSYSKAFIGDIIDRALTVRDEWAASRTHLPNPEIPPQVTRLGLGKPTNHNPGAKPQVREVADAGLYTSQVDMTKDYLLPVDKEAGLADRLKMEDKGPLTPGHLREALRRYKKDREGGGAGFAGMSLEGVERTMGRTGGRRLFR